VAERGPGYRAVLRNRDFRLMLSGFAISAIGSWAYNIALWVWIYQKTGSATWVAASTLSRFLPALLFSSYGGVLAERFERTKVMRVCDASATITMGLLALTAALDGPVILGILFAALTTAAGVANDPAVQAMVPQVVGETELASANALYGTIDNLAVIVGPAIGAGLLLIAPPSASFAVNGASFAISVLLVSRMTARSMPTDVTEGGEAGVIAQMMVGLRTIKGSTTAAVLVGFSVIAAFAYGADTVLFIVLTEERFGADSNGVGYFLMALGVGGVLAAGLVNRLAALPRLGVVIQVGLALYCLPTALIVLVDDFRIAIALQVVRGAGTLVVDVLAITALQRLLAPHLLSRVFGAFNTLVLGALALGALVTPMLLELGIDVTLLVLGAGIPVLALGSWPWLQRMDRAAIVRLAEIAPRIKVLEVLGIFSAASRPVLERLASAATELEVGADQVVIREGETADALYVIASGEVAVEAGDGAQPRLLATLRGPAYFGEIGLLERIPRTATVRTLEPCRMWRIEGEEFLAALNENPAAASFLETARNRRGRTQPAEPHAAAAAPPEPVT
jgi:predicted MFS family arabinose efflux permease